MRPITPTKIIGIGRNFVNHAIEIGESIPKWPIFFLKPPSSMIGPGDPIVLPPASTFVEFQAEIGIVIPSRLCRATRRETERLTYGVTCVNDVTARDFEAADGQPTRAKAFDSFCPVGPRVVAVAALEELVVLCRVNGQERQRAGVGDMLFTIPYLVHFLSHVMTLEAGDLIATGTPGGADALRAGDVVEVEIPGVGTLRNPVALGREDDEHVGSPAPH
jgi:2-keto-4-pentenoate hydratase/2-oxohepta-3-ene-1,7-dioic acid hydratase in catechol pathway